MKKLIKENLKEDYQMQEFENYQIVVIDYQDFSYDAEEEFRRALKNLGV